MIYLFLIAVFFIMNMIMLGALVIDFFDLKKRGIKYASPIGMVVYFGILQILYYPVQYLEGSSTFIHLLTGLLSFSIILISCFKWRIIFEYFKEIIKNNKKEILFCCLIFAVFCILYTKVEFMLRTEDSKFYITYVADNVYTSNIGVNTQVLYKYQGIYNFYSTFVYLYHRLSSLPFYIHLLPIGIISWGPSVIFFWIFPFFLMNVSSLVMHLYRMKESFVHKMLNLSVIVFTLLLHWYLIHPYYGNTFRRITVVYLMLALYEYYKNQTWKNAVLVSLILFSFISQTSTGFFLGAMLIYALIILFSIEKRHKVMEQFGVMCLPLALYMIPLVPVTLYLVIGLYALIFLGKATKINIFFEKIIHIIGEISFFVVPSIFFILPTFNIYSSNPQYASLFREHSFDQVFGYLRFDQGMLTGFFNVLCWISLFGFIVATYKRKHPMHYFGATVGIVILTFFNPFVCQFVADKITDLVYFRIYDIIYNPLTHMLFAFGVVEWIRSLQKRNLILICLSCFFLIAGLENSLKIIPKYFNDEINVFYHTSDKEVGVLKTLREKMYVDDPDRTIVVASHIYGTELLADYKINNVVNNRVDNIEALFSKVDDESVFQQIFYRKLHDDPRYETDNLRACELARKKGVEYTIVERQYNYQMEDGLGYCGEVLFEESGYRVYVMRYDWLDTLEVERNEN